MGFPTRISRSALGPLGLRDKIPVTDPETAIAAQTYKLAWWQLAGCNVVVPLAWAEIVVDGVGAGTVGASAESWDADGGAEPGVIKLPVPGGYRLEYATSYADEAGDTVATNLSFALAGVQSITTLWHAQAFASAPHLIDVLTWNAAGAAANPVNERIFVAIW